MATLRIDRRALLAFRARATHLDRKLPAGSFAPAAASGLQDSAPRAAVMSLHARVMAVMPDAWEDPSLVQIWGPRGADYVVPREDLALFTLGRMPRDEDARLSLEQIADDIHRVLDGRVLATSAVGRALPELGHGIRSSSITGRVLIRWNASSIACIPADAPAVDLEDARLGLARRFLASFGPVRPDRFAWWAGIDGRDARTTLDALAREQIAVDLNGEARTMLASDEHTLRDDEPVRGVRLVPHDDPLIKMDGPLVVVDPQRRLEIFPVPKLRAPFWPASGGILIDGEIAGSWARQQRRVTINLWRAVAPDVREAIEVEALSVPIAGKARASVRWA